MERDMKAYYSSAAYAEYYRQCYANYGMNPMSGKPSYPESQSQGMYPPSAPKPSATGN